MTFTFIASFLYLEKAGGLQSGYRHLTILCVVGQETLKMAKDMYNLIRAVKGFDVRGLKGLRQIQNKLTKATRNHEQT